MDDDLGAGFVVTDLTGEELAALTGGQGIRKRAQRDWPRITPSRGRYVVSVAVLNVAGTRFIDIVHFGDLIGFLILVFKPQDGQSFRLAYNRAFSTPTALISQILLTTRSRK